MKSSFELAMEKFGGPAKKLSEDQKMKMAEIDSIYKARIAQFKLKADEDIIKSFSNPEEISKIRSLLAKNVMELEAKCEKEKETVRGK